MNFGILGKRLVWRANNLWRANPVLLRVRAYGSGPRGFYWESDWSESAVLECHLDATAARAPFAMSMSVPEHASLLHQPHGRQHQNLPRQLMELEAPF